MLPVFINSSPQRDYEFLFKLSAQPGQAATLIKLLSNDLEHFRSLLASFKNITEFVTNFLDDVKAAYVSQLCQSVDPPSNKIEYDSAQLGSVKCPFPKGLEINTVNAIFLDDRYGTVYNYHLNWQLLGLASAADGNKTLSMKPLSACARQLIVANTIRTPALQRGMSQLTGESQVLQTVAGMLPALETPTNVTLYPRVFPIEIKRSQLDRSKKGISTVSVVYLRIPKISGIKPYTHVPPVESRTVET